MEIRTCSKMFLNMIIALAFNGSAIAAETFWVKADPGGFGGDYTDPASWSDGVPGPLDTAIFDLSTIGPGFPPDDPIEVCICPFPAKTIVTDRLFIRRGSYEFEISPGSYSVDNTSFLTPSLVIGETFKSPAKLTILEGDAHFVHAHIGNVPGSIGTLILGTHVFEHETSADFSGVIRVGEEGDGSLFIADNAAGSALGTYVGASIGSRGEIIVSGANATYSSGLTTIGHFGHGVLTIEEGIVDSGETILAHNYQASAEAVVAGFESLWQIDGSLDVGFEGAATLDVLSGADVFIDGFLAAGISVQPFLPELPVGEGHISVLGAGSTLTATQAIHIGFVAESESSLTMSEGSIVAAPLIEIGEFAALIGSGALVGDVDVYGELLPSFPTDGVFEIDGALALQDTAVFHVEAAGPSPTQHTSVLVHGMTHIEGTINIELLDGFMLKVGEFITVIGATETLEMGLLNIVGPPLPPLQQWTAIATDKQLSVGVVDAVPDPDIDGSGDVGPGDLAIILGSWGPCPAEPEFCFADLNQDGTVGPGDLAIVLGSWG